MARNTKKTRIKKVSGKTVAKALGILAVCIYVACTFVKQQITLSKCDDVADEYRAKIAEAQAENQKLEDELEKADTDEYLEQIAREKLGLVKPNERVFIDITQQ
ncbi:MAG: septum formation initiator family protein [Clostridia bacterium]|nr:septum formation initiator family protein [Clostridia bacterium]